MRAIAILAVVASMASVWVEANAQPSPSPPASPQASPQPSPPPSPTTGSGRGLPQAPVGHRQPRATDVPNQGDVTRSETDVQIDRQLNICRGC
jgi:hypothetical protein